MEVPRPVNTHITTAFHFNNYCLEKQSQEYNNLFSGKIPKWARKMDVQMKTTLFKPSDPIAVLSSFDIFKTAWNSNSIHEGGVMWLFPHFIRKPAKIVLARRVKADIKNQQ